MRKQIIALSLSMLFLGGMAGTSYAQVTSTSVVVKTRDDDNKNKKKETKKECKTEKSSCCKHDFAEKSCKDKKDRSKHK